MSEIYLPFVNDSIANNVDLLSIDFARILDENDQLHSYRDKFYFPTSMNNHEQLYFNGNSLGLMPKESKIAVDEQLEKWANRGAAGHVEEPLPWLACDEYLIDDISDIVGANRNEVALMNQLSVNLHFMLVSFYRPTKNRYKILCEHQAFSSDHYAFESQIEWHGYNPKEGCLTLKPREGEVVWRSEDIIEFIKENGHEIALICFSGVHYLTGQWFDIENITKTGHNVGCVVGWDLAHAVGNVPLQLHDWNVDFAVWCSYKYLNSGAGGIGGIFVHEENLKKENVPYFRGWWGHRKSDRLEMSNIFEPADGALKYRISNTSFTACVLLQTSLKMFKEVGMAKLRDKSIKLTGYFEYIFNRKVNKDIFKIITPKNINERGSQLSIQVMGEIELVKRIIKENNIVCDFRNNSILRMSPCPFYSSFMDVYKLVEILSLVR